MTQDTRNVHQRKLAVMKRCAVITPDSKYNGQTKDGRPIRFEYLSVQAISNHVRGFCVEEGLDLVPSISDNLVVLELVNADQPDDKIVATWPIVPNDKAWAYSLKYALIRTFLIGDGEEGDEAEMAGHSEQAATQRSNGHRPEPKPAAIDGTTPEQMETLYALTDKLGQSHLEVDALVRRHGYTRILERATASIAEKEASEQPTLPAVAAALNVPPAGSES